MREEGAAPATGRCLALGGANAPSVMPAGDEDLPRFKSTPPLFAGATPPERLPRCVGFLRRSAPGEDTRGWDAGRLAPGTTDAGAPEDALRTGASARRADGTLEVALGLTAAGAPLRATEVDAAGEAMDELLQGACRAKAAGACLGAAFAAAKPGRVCRAKPGVACPGGAELQRSPGALGVSAVAFCAGPVWSTRAPFNGCGGLESCFKTVLSGEVEEAPTLAGGRNRAPGGWAFSVVSEASGAGKLSDLECIPEAWLLAGLVAAG